MCATTFSSGVLYINAHDRAYGGIIGDSQKQLGLCFNKHPRAQTWHFTNAHANPYKSRNYFFQGQYGFDEMLFFQTMIS